MGGGLRGGRVRLRTGRIQFIPRAHRMRAGPYAGDSKDCKGCSLQGCIRRSGVFRTASPSRSKIVASTPCQLVVPCLTTCGLVKPALEDAMPRRFRRLRDRKPAGIFAPGVSWVCEAPREPPVPPQKVRQAV